ncbi:hypothetical protein DPEC_G00039450 [Dallia pectoralis]|uniref:Uncharacterized protein n=1 Tax=Dallia pectoralis TaxID=75939 RepID=A0ACC2HFU0_DALPE|nr:hypothetical protein DPEC_G00039450 [Dallia pectoralis]
MHVFSKSTSAALRYMVEKECRPESFLTTSWFLEKMDHWFELMSSRSIVTALSHFKMEEYEKAISFLRDSIHLFQGLKIDPRGSWKPVQTGLLMATTTILEEVEQLFCSQTSDSLIESSNVVAELEREAMSLDSNLPSCHELRKKSCRHTSG